MDTKNEQRINEYHITDHIKIYFSICHVWSEEEDFVAQIFLRIFTESEWNIGLLVGTYFISGLIRMSQSSCLPGVWVRVVSDILII